MTTLGGEVGKVKDDVAAQKAAIEETQAKLQRAMGDLGEQSGLIARNAEELDALKRAGLREYYEFDLAKAKSPAAVGPVALRLKDADAKRHKFNMVLVVDDIQIEKKDKTLLEPVQFYRKGSRQLHEIVVYAVAEGPDHGLPEHAEGRGRGGLRELSGPARAAAVGRVARRRARRGVPRRGAARARLLGRDRARQRGRDASRTRRGGRSTA